MVGSLAWSIETANSTVDTSLIFALADSSLSTASLQAVVQSLANFDDIGYWAERVKVGLDELDRDARGDAGDEDAEVLVGYRSLLLVHSIRSYYCQCISMEISLS